MNMDYIKVIDSFVETVNTPILVIDDRSYVISSNIGLLRRALVRMVRMILFVMYAEQVTRSVRKISDFYRFE